MFLQAGVKVHWLPLVELKHINTIELPSESSNL
ncbi:putative deoxycytidylate deaminase [Vibrio cholerae]|nr:putative deoxycytidylate deaminase [Vibrio cholerae]